MEMHQPTSCIHRWVLSEPRMRTVAGVCRRCGARRTYPSGLEVPEAVPDYGEMEAGLPVARAAISSPEKYALA